MEDCSKASIEVTKLRCGDNFQLCFQTSQNGWKKNPQWTVLQYGSGNPPVQLTGYSNCLSFNTFDGNIIRIKLTVDEYIGTDTIRYFCNEVFTLDCESGCSTLGFSSDFLFCHGDFTLNSSKLGGKVFIDYGDGSNPVKVPEGLTKLSHNYWNGGNYQVCLTQLMDGMLMSCCDSVTVTPCGPEFCDNVLLEDQEISYNESNGHLIVKYTFKTFSDIQSYIWNFGDNTPTITTTSNVATHEFNMPGCYNICVTVNLGHGEQYTCCFEKVYGDCNCCMTAEFNSIDSLPYSCIMGKYRFIPLCTISSDSVRHCWIFGDGSPIYKGVFPPDHVFSNFVTEDGYVNVTHIVTCGKYKLVYTKKIFVGKGAYLGYENKITKFTDFLHWETHPADIRVDDYIQQYSQNPSVPLLIQGVLHGNTTYYFNGGIWNMAKNSVIYLKSETEDHFGPTLPSMTFGLNNTTIQDAIRIGRINCCRWQGIVNDGPNKLIWNSSTISDAKIMLDLLYGDEGKSVATLTFTQNLFLENDYGIRSVGQLFNIEIMNNNEFRGPYNCNLPDVGICDCYVSDAIHVENINGASIVFPMTNQHNNLIQYYQNGLYASNSNVVFRNFDIKNGILNLSTPLLSSNAVYVKMTNTANSFNMDDVYFHSLLRGAKFDLSKANLKLNATANVPYSSIVMDEVTKGYDITATLGHIDGTIQYNSITTTGTTGAYLEGSRGIKVALAGSANNKLTIKQNTITGDAKDLIGVSVTGNVPTAQKVIVDDNDITSFSSGSNINGAGIYLSNINTANIINNAVDASSKINGITVQTSSKGYIKCNDVTHGKVGLDVNESKSNIIYNNNLHNNDVNNLRFILDCKGTGTRIVNNTFSISENGNDVFYDNKAFTGPQLHKYYNKWLNQSGVEVYQPYSYLTDQTKYWRPASATIGSIHFPQFYVNGMMVSAADNTVLQAPYTCAAQGSGLGDGGGFTDPETPDEFYGLLAADTTYYSSMTSAEQDGLRQSIMDNLYDNPTWLTSNSVLANFASSQSNTFIGHCTTIRKNMADLQANINAQLMALKPLQDSVTHLRSILDGIYETMLLTNDSLVLLQLQSQANLILSSIASISSQIQSQQVQDGVMNIQTLDAISSANTSMNVAGTNQWNERLVNDYTIKTWKQIPLDTTEIANLKIVASMCYPEGGRAVYFARELVNALFDVYITEDDCVVQSPVNQRASDTQTSKGTISISPNPVSEMLNVELSDQYNGQELLLCLYTVTGHEINRTQVKSYNGGGVRLKVNEFPEGIYFLHINGGGTTNNFKVVVKR